jgi:hypothetical protein
MMVKSTRKRIHNKFTYTFIIIFKIVNIALNLFRLGRGSLIRATKHNHPDS